MCPSETCRPPNLHQCLVSFPGFPAVVISRSNCVPLYACQGLCKAHALRCCLPSACCSSANAATTFWFIQPRSPTTTPSCCVYCRASWSVQETTPVIVVSSCTPVHATLYNDACACSKADLTSAYSCAAVKIRQACPAHLYAVEAAQPAVHVSSCRGLPPSW